MLKNVQIITDSSHLCDHWKQKSPHVQLQIMKDLSEDWRNRFVFLTKQGILRWEVADSGPASRAMMPFKIKLSLYFQPAIFGALAFVFLLFVSW